MRAFDNIKNIFFIGIGGIGMSSIARYFNENGFRVSGYDRTKSDLICSLEAEGIHFIDTFTPAALQHLSAETTLVVYTAAIQSDNPFLEYFGTYQFKCLKRAKVLGQLTAGKPTLAVAGTHGKTTTSALLAYMLYCADIKVTGFLGGILNNFQSNYVSKGNDVFVVEADEFDRSFLALSPTKACVIAMDPDHLDIYETAEAFQKTFRDFAKKLPSKDQLFISDDVDLEGQVISLSTAEADIHIKNIRIKEGSFYFDYVSALVSLTNIKSNLPGKYNVLNSAMALSLAISYQPKHTQIFADALASFEGIQRRFNKVIDTEDLVLIDDYAHHPKEIAAVLEAVNDLYPTEKKSVIFQSHLYSRTRDFADEFASVLNGFDEVNLLEIYPAREEPIAGINAAFLCDKITTEKRIIGRNEISGVVYQNKNRIVLMLGAGDIGIEVQKLIKEKQKC